MSRRRKRGVVVVLSVAAVVLGIVVGCDESQEPPAIPEPNEAAVQQPTHDQIAGVPALKANADDLKATVIAPHMAVPLEPDKNVLWCATFQMAWNELADLLGHKLSDYQGSSEMVPLLNHRSVTKDDLNEASYVALAGYPTGRRDDIFKRIAEALGQKFGNTARPKLVPPRQSPGATDPVAYAYLFRSLPFEWPFGRSQTQGLSFEGSQVQAFGLGGLFWREAKPAPEAKRQVTVVDYRDASDFIIMLQTLSESDRLVLAKIPAKATLEQTVQSVQDRLDTAADQSPVRFRRLHVPVLNFDLDKQYTELLRLGSTIQQIRFKLDETGAVLKSEAVLSAITARTSEPVDLIFDKPFLIVLQRRDAANPYFALWVANAELLVPVEDKS